MLESFAWGFLAASPLIVGGAVALRWRVEERLLGWIMAFGGGVLISAVSFELVEEAFDTSSGDRRVALGLACGSLTFFAGDLLIDRMGGDERKRSGGKQAEGSALAIVLGIVLDGIPESIVLGLTIVVSGSISAAFLVAVVLSNVPETIAAIDRPRAGRLVEGPRPRPVADGVRSSRGSRPSSASRCSTRLRRAPSRSSSPSRAARS